MPQRFPGIYYVGARVDALNQIAEPLGFTPGRENPPLDPNAFSNNNTFVSDIATRVQILSSAGPDISMASQVSDSSGAPILQSDGFSDIASIDEQGTYVVFESYARDLAVPQEEAQQVLGTTITGIPPLWSDLGAGEGEGQGEGENSLTAFQSNGRKQIYRRNTQTRKIDIASVSSSGAQATQDALNAFINADGTQVAFESRAGNLVSNDTGGNSDIFVRSYQVLRTVRVSVNASGIQGNASSFAPSLSDNGRFVAFESQATNLDPANPKAAGNNNSQIFVHDRDASGTGIYDSPGNVRTYLVSVTPIGLQQATATATVAGGRVTSIAVNSGGSGYLPAAPPAVVLTGGDGKGAKAVANVSPDGAVVSVSLTSTGSGYTSAPTVSIAPRAAAADGWCNQARISGDGKYLTFVSYSSNLPLTAGGSAIGTAGYRGVVYRVGLADGMPQPLTMQAVSVDTAGNLANAISYEPVINGDGSQIAYTSLADNLVSDDLNGVADIFVRDFTNNRTVRVSESLNRFAYGTISFPALPTLPQTPPANNPADGDEITLSDGVKLTPEQVNKVKFTFRRAPAAADDVLIGATAAQSRDNLVSAINSAAQAGRLGIRAVADSPANPNPFYAPNTRIPGQSYSPSLFLVATTVGAEGNVDIEGNFTVLSSSGGISEGEFPGGNLITVSGMQAGGVQAENDAGDLDGVPAGSTMPSIDRSGMVVAFRSTMQTMDVFDKTYTGQNGLRPGDILRMLRNASANVYIRERDADGSGEGKPDAAGNVNTKRISVNKFGYATSALANTPSSANSHKPALSAGGRYVAFSSDSENNGGLAFGRTNLDPQDTNGYRDVFVHDRDVTSEPPAPETNNAPDVTLTEPSWLSIRELSVGSVIYLNALVTDADEELGLQNVSFYVNGVEVPAQNRYGDSYSASYKIDSISSSNIIQARARDNAGASNSITTSAPITFASVASIPQPTSVTMLPLPRGTLPQVGEPLELSARYTLPIADFLYNSGVVRFYANGILIGSVPVAAGVNSDIATLTWYPSTTGTVTLSAVASTVSYFFATENPRAWATLESNKLAPTRILGVNESPMPGTPDEMVLYIYQTVLSRSPDALEFEYWSDQLSSGAVTPTGMVLQLIGETEYNDLQNRLFGYYYWLNTAPAMPTYLQNLGFMEADLNPLPDAGYPTVNAIASPYGAAVGDATAAQAIVSSSAFATANPGQQTLSNQNFMVWYFGQTKAPSGPSTQLVAAMNGYTPTAESKGYAVAFISALAETHSGDGTAFEYQLKATSLQWLFTGIWQAPTSPTVTTAAGLNAFVAALIAEEAGVSTWSWVDQYGLSDSSAGPEASPAGDGVTNLMKYAFNMSPLRAYTGADRDLQPNGTSGLPLITTVDISGASYMQITYVRRVNPNSVTYQPQFGSSLSDPAAWQSATVQVGAPIKIDDVWERVTVRDSLPTSSVRSRFAQVKLTASYWLP